MTAATSAPGVRVRGRHRTPGCFTRAVRAFADTQLAWQLRFVGRLLLLLIAVVALSRGLDAVHHLSGAVL